MVWVNKIFNFVREAGRSLMPRVDDTKSMIGSSEWLWKCIAIRRSVSPYDGEPSAWNVDDFSINSFNQRVTFCSRSSVLEQKW